MEWTSLSLFTVLAEAAVGLVLIYGLMGLTATARDEAEAYASLARPVLWSATLLTGVAMLISLTHLGWPQFAFRSLGGLPSSWLSWEILLTGLFALGALFLAWRAHDTPPPLWAIYMLAGVGLGATYASGMIYTLPSLPANAGGAPVLLFLATTLLTGSGLFLLLLASKWGKALAPRWIPLVALLAVGAIILTGAITLVQIGAASAGVPEAQAQAAVLTGSAWYLIRLLIGLLLPAGLLLWSGLRTRLSPLTVTLPVLLVLAGEVTGRLLFFVSSTFTGINTGF